MKFDTFISYSSADKTTADAVCAKLESIGIRCWIAPRDVVPGREYAAAIIDAIDRCRVMVLIFSADSNESRQIHREIERAASKGTPIVPLRIEEVIPTESMEYFLGGIHWLDALTPPLERHLHRLAETVVAILGVDASDKATSQVEQEQLAQPPRGIPSPRRIRLAPRPALVLGSALLALTLAAGMGFIWHSSQSTLGEAPTSAKPPLARLAQFRALVPETVPFISDSDRIAVRSDYLPAADHKALAISTFVSGFVTGQPDDQAARQAAIAKCDTLRAAVEGKTTCQIYAVGNEVVNAISPPMPRSPWLLRNPAIERPFSANDLPVLGDVSFYTKVAKSKALALSFQRRPFAYWIQSSVEEAARRALEACGYVYGSVCMIVAVDDIFVVPVPRAATVTGVFAARGNNLIASEWQEILAGRLEQAPNAWNGVAVGASGRPGLVLDALNEQDAIEGALADCARNDRDCRIIAIGPFAVEPTTLAGLEAQQRSVDSLHRLIVDTVDKESGKGEWRGQLADYSGKKNPKALVVCIDWRQVSPTQYSGTSYFRSGSSRTPPGSTEAAVTDANNYCKADCKATCVLADRDGQNVLRPPPGWH
jgi:hypothetical protein